MMATLFSVSNASVSLPLKVRSIQLSLSSFPVEGGHIILHSAIFVLSNKVHLLIRCGKIIEIVLV